MSTSGSDFICSARDGIPLLIAQASNRSGSLLTTLPYQPGPKRACSRKTSGANPRPPAAACRKPSVRRSNQRGTSGGTNQEPGGIEGVERQARLAAEQQVGDQFAGHGREQDAVAEVTGRDAQPAPFAKAADDRHSVGGSRPQARPRLDEGGLTQAWRELHCLLEEPGNDRRGGTRVEADVLDGRSDDRVPVRPRQGVAIAIVDHEPQRSAG